MGGGGKNFSGNNFSGDINFCIYCYRKEPHKCALPLVEKLKKTSRQNLIDRILSFDIGYILAFTGLVVMNCVLIRHMNLTFNEALIEGLAFGFAIPRLLK